MRTISLWRDRQSENADVRRADWPALHRSPEETFTTIKLLGRLLNPLYCFAIGRQVRLFLQPEWQVAEVFNLERGWHARN